jgi:hypothetical protein
VIREEATNNSFIVIGFTQPGIELMIFIRAVINLRKKERKKTVKYR